MSTPPSTTPRRNVLGAVLGLAMGLSNLIGYLMVLVLTRSLGPEDFGGYTALSTYGVLLAIPAGAFQVVIARRISARDETGRTSGVRLALVLGLVAFAVTAALSPVLATTFHVDSAWSAVALGAMLPPMMLTGCFQGILLGRHRMGRLSSLYMTNAVTRLLAAVVAAWLDFSVLQVFLAMLAAGVVTSAVGAQLCADDVRALPGTADGLAGEMIRSNSTLAAFVALTNVDVLLARHFLTQHESGGYALASTFGRALYWGTQFIALIIVPRMHGANASRTLLRAGALVVLIGGLGVGVIALSPEFWITAAGGAEFTSYGHLALICVVLGIAWALAQVWLFSDMGRDDGSLGVVTWVVVAAQCAVVAVWAHESPGQIVAVCLAGALVIALVGLARVLRDRRRPREVELLVADGA